MNELTVTYGNQQIVLRPGQVAHIGRREDSTLVIRDPRVSRDHVQLSWGPQGWILINLGQAGTFVFGQAVTQFPLAQPVAVHLAAADGPTVRLDPTAPRVTHEASVTQEAGEPGRPVAGLGTQGTRSAADERRQELRPRRDRSATARTEAERVHVHWQWRPMILLVFASIALVTGIWAVAIFPSRAPIVYPQPFRVEVVSNYSVARIYISVHSSGQYTYMQVSGVTGSSSSLLLSGGFIDIWIVGNTHVNCPSGVSCPFFPAQGATPAQSEMIIPITISANETPVNYYVSIDDPRFGPAGNGESVAAQLPTVSTAASLSGPAPQIDIAYEVPNADTYDWSTPPTTYIGGNWADWSEQLSNSPSEIPPVALTGTNTTIQSQDSRDTFVAGVLLGIAGAAVIVLAQEGMHMLLDRNKKRSESRTSTTELSRTGG